MKRIINYLRRILIYIKSKYILNLKFGKNLKIGIGIVTDFKNGGEIIYGNNCTVGDYCIFRTASNKIIVGDNVSIGAFNFFHATGGIHIGNNTRIADHVSIHAANHNFSNKFKLIVEQGKTANGIIIGNDVWIGSGVKILDGVSIGDGCVIGAGSVVTKSIKEYSIAVGIPAKEIRKRE
jgi:acetyltransferase-like isoleucine patch superfamily enzyme